MMMKTISSEEVSEGVWEEVWEEALEETACSAKCKWVVEWEEVSNSSHQASFLVVDQVLNRYQLKRILRMESK